MSTITLAAGLTALGIALPEAAQRKLLDFRDLLLKWNRTYNLTALRDPRQAISHHLLDALVVVPHVGAGPLLDVGSGGGLPGIPLAIAPPRPVGHAGRCGAQESGLPATGRDRA